MMDAWHVAALITCYGSTNTGRRDAVPDTLKFLSAEGDAGMFNPRLAPPGADGRPWLSLPLALLLSELPKLLFLEIGFDDILVDLEAL